MRSDIESYWAEIHERVSNQDLGTKSAAAEEPTNVPYNCIVVANEIGERLAELEAQPSALFITHEEAIRIRHEDDIDPSDFPKIKPKVWEGVTWTYHVVCEADGYVYDPLLPQPLPLADYLVEMFDEPVVVHPLIITYT